TRRPCWPSARRGSTRLSARESCRASASGATSASCAPTWSAGWHDSATASGAKTFRCPALSRLDRRIVDRERLGNERRVRGTRDVVQVLHRRVDVGVAHPLLDPADVSLANHSRAEGVAQVMEPKPPQTRPLQRRLVASDKSTRIEVLAVRARQDEVLVGGPGVALAELGERLSDLRRHGDRAHLPGFRRRLLSGGDGRADADRVRREVDVAPAQGDQLAATQPGERRGEEQRCVLFARRRAHQRHDLLGREDLDVTAAPLRGLLDIGDRVDVEAVDLARSLEDAVHEHERLRSRAGRLIQAGEPPFDHRRRDALERLIAERREKRRANDDAVALDGGRLALAVVLDVAQPLGGRIRERRPRAHHSRQRSAPSLVERVAQPVLRQALGLPVAIAAGAAMPGCSRTTMPLAMGLRGMPGQRLGNLTALIFVAPLLSPITIALTWSVLGWRMTVARVIASLLGATLLGTLINRREQWFEPHPRTPPLAGASPELDSCQATGERCAQPSAAHRLSTTTLAL